jgi:hypothetical protein
MALVIENFPIPTTGAICPKAYIKAEVERGKLTVGGARVYLFIYYDYDAYLAGKTFVDRLTFFVPFGSAMYNDYYSSLAILGNLKNPETNTYDLLKTLDGSEEISFGIDWRQAMSSFNDSELAQGTLDGLPNKETGERFFRESTKEVVQWGSVIADWFSVDN